MLPAQCDETKRLSLLAMGIEAGVLALDRPFHHWITEPSGDSPHGLTKALVSVGNHLGQARVLIPTLAGAYLMTRLTHHHDAARSTGRIAAGYIASDAVTAILKPVVGRARPSTSDHPLHFHAFSASDAYHAFPSGHLTHITSVVTGTLAEFPNPGTRIATVLLPGIVGWQRMYTNAHWLSDVTAGAFVGMEGRCLARGVLGHRW